MKRLVMILMVLLLGVVAQAQTKAWNAATRPTFPVCAYYQPTENFDRWKARGIDVVVGPEIGNPARLTPRQWCEAAERAGLWVIADQRIDWRPPNLYAWIQEDEPDRRGVSPEVLIAQAKKFRTIAADVPILGVFEGPKVTSAGARDIPLYQAFGQSIDVAAEDWYPYNKIPTRYTISLKGQALDRLATWTGRPVWTVVEVSAQAMKEYAQGRAPTVEEWESSLWHAVSHGARGVICFSHAFQSGWPAGYDQTTAAIAARMPAVHARLKASFDGKVLVAEFPTQPTQPSQPATQPSDVADLSKIREDLAAIRAELNRIFR